MSSFSWEPFGQAREAGTGDDPPSAPMPAAAPVPPQRRQPSRRLAIITCMDARIDPLAALGLSLGDANVLRNAGATVSDDVLRSLGAAIELLGVAQVVLMGHTDCAGHDGDAAAAAAVADGARRLRSHLPQSFGIDALMYDVSTGAVKRL